MGIAFAAEAAAIALLLVFRENPYAFALLSGVVFFATVGISLLVLGDQARFYFTDLLGDAGRIGPIGTSFNQSWRGGVSRILGYDAGYGPAVLAALAVTAVLAVLAWRAIGGASDRLGAILVVQLFGLLLSPISWTHHWVWCVPVALVLWTEARQHIWTLAVFWSHVVAIPHNAFTTVTRYSPFVTIVSGAYAYFGAFFLALVVHRAVHAQRSTRTSSTCRQSDVGDPPV